MLMQRRDQVGIAQRRTGGDKKEEREREDGQGKVRVRAQGVPGPLTLPNLFGYM
jgi:hypothetical protein